DQASVASADDPVGRLLLAGYVAQPASVPTVDLARFVASDARAHRAAALAQIGRGADAIQELRAGLALARTPAEKERWKALTLAMGTSLADRASPPRSGDLDYPTPELTPLKGFTLDRALVYAMVRAESRFNPQAVSPVGASGLMQIMPTAAAAAAGDDKLKFDRTPLFDPAFNLRVGQDYFSWLLEKGVGHDLVKAVAAYNAGPAPVARTAQMLGADADALLLMECLPAQETRSYVQKVLAGYWTYRKMWGQPSPTLDAVAAGERAIDERLDLGQPRGPATQYAAQSLQVGMR
ncbi:MAG: lytic transglycosylase domain-containing protein, partial [Phenylobacterium sp.]